MAQPSHVYEITWNTSMTESQVEKALSDFHVLQVKREGTASKQRKWGVVIQSSSLSTTVRTKLKDLPNVLIVRIKE